MRKTLLTLALLTLGASGSAFAGDTASTELVLTVNTVCNFSTDYPTLTANLSDTGDVGWQGAMVALSGFDVMCNAGTAYTIEADAAAGGQVMLSGDTAANSVPAYLWQGVAPGSTPFSTVANGEAITGVATGEFDRKDFTVSFNTQSDGSMPLPLPVADTYRRVVNFTLTY